MATELPPWMKFLQTKLANPSTPLNIRLFVSKLIINTEEVTTPGPPHSHLRLGTAEISSGAALDLTLPSPQVFRPYAKHFLGPLLQLVVSGNNGGDGIHFMVVDIVVTVLSWISVATPKVFSTSYYSSEDDCVWKKRYSIVFIRSNDPG